MIGVCYHEVAEALGRLDRACGYRTVDLAGHAGQSNADLSRGMASAWLLLARDSAILSPSGANSTRKHPDLVEFPFGVCSACPSLPPYFLLPQQLI